MNFKIPIFNPIKTEVLIPEIKILPERKLVGKKLAMSIADNKTGELWHSFMPRRKEIVNVIGADLYSMQVYDPTFDLINFNISARFDKWATAEVSSFDVVPEGMETFLLPAGQYAVFHYKGSSENAAAMFNYIFTEWLPGSGYRLDDRPHFEILGPGYRNNDSNSEEQICIPIQPR